MKYLIIWLTLFTAGLSVYGQNPSVITLSSPDSGNKNYAAQTKVQMTPGYKYTGSANSMRAYIEQSTTYQSLFSNAAFDAYTTNTGLTVGATAGGMEVSASGGMGYNIPIELPAGTNGMIPNLGISYNSQGWNDILGMGWSLNGLSSISVAPTSWYQEGSVQEVKLDGTDKFAMDGNRLHLVSGTYGADNAVYYTESESFNKITSYGSGTGPQWFKVETKDGITMEFGNTTESRVKSQGSNAFITWKLNKMYDTYGNFIEFIYRVQNNDYRIDKINYSGNTIQGIAPYNTILFSYKTRTDANSEYVAGNEFKMNTLLDAIAIFSDGELFKTYDFFYGENQFSYLSMIKETGADGSKLNATIFKYGEKGEDIEVTATTFSGPSSDLSSGDYNGDGKADLLVRYAATWEVLVSDGIGGFSHYASGAIPSGYTVFFNPKMPNLRIPGMSNTFDFYGDGQDDLIFAKYNTSVNQDGEMVFHNLEIIIQDINGVDNLGTPYSPPINAGGYFLPSRFLNIGDYDGDGRDDVLYIKYPSESNLTASAQIITVTGGVETVVLDGGLQNVNFAHSIYPNDFDGDGVAEILVKNSSQWESFELKRVSGVFHDNRIYYSSGSGYFPHSEIFPGDFNGDGKTDILTANSGRTSWTIGYSTGTNYVLKPFVFNNPTNLTGIELLTRIEVKVVDLNGDGKSDILHIGDTEDDLNSVIDFYPSNGMNFQYKTKTINLIGSYFDLVYGDFNGDGKTEIYNPEPPAYTDQFYFFNKDGKDKLLSKVRNGFGQITEVTYDWLSKGTNYVKETGAVWPIVDIQPAVSVVKSVISPNGVGGNTTINYAYSGAKLHAHGKGFLGFKSTTVSDVVSNTKATREFEYQSTPKLILLKKEKLNELSTGNLLSEVTYTNTVTMTGLRYKVEVTGVNENDALNTITTTKTISYDNYGNPLQIVVNNGVETTTTTNVPATFGTWWIPSVVSSVTVNTVRTGETAYQRKKNYVYNAKGMVDTEVADQGTPKAVTVTYLYDNFGNMIQSSKNASGGLLTVNKMVYDTKGRFVIKAINALNQEHIFVRNKKWGTADSETDISGKISSNTYNGFGRLTSTTDPIGITTNIDYTWDITSGGSGAENPNNTIYKVVARTFFQPEKTTWYDQLGRVVKTNVDGISGSKNVVSKYNANGTLASVTAPFFNMATPIVTQYTYDNYQRLASSNNGVAPVSYTYAAASGQQTSTVTSPLGTKTQVTDAAGRIISSTDDGGVLTYTYYSSGNQKKVSLDGIEVAAMEYDQYGRQTKLTDKNSGVSTYEYSAYGLLISQNNANNESYTMIYDVLGREVSRTGPDGITSSTYVTSGNGLNKPKKITAPNGVYTEYTYDTDNRISNVANSIDGTVYNSVIDYDPFGRQSALTYPSGFKVKYYYDGQSNLTSVKSDNGAITYYMAPAENAYGQLTQYQRGNGKTTTNTFTNYGYLSSSITSGVQNYQPNFSPATGNMIYRRDNMKSRIENMTFDNSNRLTGSIVTASGNPLVLNSQVIDYAANGNITEKDDVGEYEYNTEKTNAVTNVANPYSEISTTLQEIEYTPFDRVESINEGIYHMDFTYGPSLDRVKTVLKQSGTTIKTKYFVGSYEKEVTPSGTKEICYINTPGGQVANVTENSVSTDYYIYTDHLGTPVAVTNAAGTVVAEQNFDAWGKRRNYVNWGATSVQVPTAQFSWLRGFTGHEHLEEFQLINMNNRLYDPLLGRMLSVDNFVQDPSSSQSYNRYSYVNNNPLKYTDPTGEIAVEWLSGFFSGKKGKSFKERLAEGDRRVRMSYKLTWGLFQYDKSYSGKGDVFRDIWQVISRTSWEAPQTVVGLFFDRILNTHGKIEDVDYYHGATVSFRKDIPESVSLGSYITLGTDEPEKEIGLGIGAGSYTTMHEYGHYLQSRKMGPVYLSKVGLQSSIGNAFWTERDANYRAAVYFHRIDKSFNWNEHYYSKNPGSIYTNFLNPGIENNSPVKPHWWEFMVYIAVPGTISGLLSVSTGAP